MVVNLDVRIKILRTVNTQDPKFRSMVARHEVLAPVWSEWTDVVPTRTSRDEAQREGLVQGRKQARVRIRYRDDVDASMVLQRGTRIATIIGGPVVLGRKEYLQMLVEEFTTRGGA